MATTNEPKIRFTAQTWAEIRDELIRLIKERNPQWTDYLPSDFGITLVELFAAAIRMIRHYQNLHANEAFLSTAILKESLVRFADWFNYLIPPPGAATVDLTFTKSNVTEDVTIPKHTVVRTQGGAGGGGRGSPPIRYYTLSQLYIPAGTASGIVSAINAEPHEGEILGISDGSVGQSYALTHNPLVRYPSGELALRVYVGGEEWKWTDALRRHWGEEKVYQVRIDADDRAWILFGDGVNGALPPAGAEIVVDYYTGGGTEGLVGANTLTVLETHIPGIASVTNPSQSTGASDSLDKEQLRSAIIAQVRTLKRLVTKQDYMELIPADNPEVEKIQIAHPYDNRVDIYIMPHGGVPPSQALLDQIQEYVNARAIETDLPVVQAPTITPVEVEADLVLIGGYSPDEVLPELVEALRELLNRYEFSDTIYINDIYAFFEQRPEVKEATIKKLARYGDSGLQNLYTNIGEVFKAGDIRLNVVTE